MLEKCRHDMNVCVLMARLQAKKDKSKIAEVCKRKESAGPSSQPYAFAGLKVNHSNGLRVNMCLAKSPPCHPYHPSSSRNLHHSSYIPKCSLCAVAYYQLGCMCLIQTFGFSLWRVRPVCGVDKDKEPIGGNKAVKETRNQGKGTY